MAYVSQSHQCEPSIEIWRFGSHGTWRSGASATGHKSCPAIGLSASKALLAKERLTGDGCLTVGAGSAIGVEQLPSLEGERSSERGRSSTLERERLSKARCQSSSM